MKIGCASWGFRKLTLQEYFEAVSSLGVKFLEVECFNEKQASNTIPESFTKKEMVYLQEQTKKQELQIVSFAGGNDFTVQDKSSIKDDIVRIKKMIDLAEAGGVEIIRLFAGWAEENEITDIMYEQVINGFKEVGEYAQNKGITIALENHGGITKTPDRIEKLLSGVNLSSVGLNYDPANFHHCKVNPEEALKSLKEYIVYVHLKDSQFINDVHEYKAVGEGEIDWTGIFNWLKTSYQGYAMIEYENPDDVVEGTKHSLDYLRNNGVAV